MTKDLRLIRVCDHITVFTYEIISPSTLVTRSAISNIDYISNDNIKRIVSVSYIDENCDIIIYINDVDYILYSADKIKWISEHKPSDNLQYMVSYIYDNNTTTEHELEDCPKCNGVGWYAKSISEVTNNLDNTDGIYKLVQDVIKILLTDKDSNGYGTNLSDVLGQDITNQGEIIRQVSDEITYAQNQYINYQRELESKGVALSLSERLRNIVIRNTSIDLENLSISIDVVISNYEDNNAQVSINL